ncbi:hypothetical protein BDV10DRAFT_24234 [Aspergillus recurvatus]
MMASDSSYAANHGLLSSHFYGRRDTHFKRWGILRVCSISGFVPFLANEQPWEFGRSWFPNRFQKIRHTGTVLSTPHPRAFSKSSIDCRPLFRVIWMNWCDADHSLSICFRRQKAVKHDPHHLLFLYQNENAYRAWAMTARVIVLADAITTSSLRVYPKPSYRICQAQNRERTWRSILGISKVFITTQRNNITPRINQESRLGRNIISMVWDSPQLRTRISILSKSHRPEKWQSV